MTDTERDLLAEIQRLKAEIHACERCNGLRDRIIDIYNVLPPPPVMMDAMAAKIFDEAWR